MDYFYEIGYTSWEECPTIVLCHSKKFTKDEFDNIVLDCYVECSKIRESEHDGWVFKWRDSEGYNIEDEEYNKYTPRVSELNADCYKMLIDKYGFKDIEITCGFRPSDCDGIVTNSFDDNLRKTGDPDLNMLRERFNVIEPRDNKINDILKDG